VAISVAVKIKRIQLSNYPLPRLVHYDYDVKRRWYVIFYLPHDNNPKKLRRYRVFNPINESDIVKVRLHYAEKIIQEWTVKLKQGYTYPASEEEQEDSNDIPVEPEEDEGIKPSQITFLEAIVHVKNKKEGSIRESTLGGYDMLYNAMEEFLTSKERTKIRLKEITSPFLYSFFDWLKKKRNISNKTYNNYQIILHAVYDYFHERYPRQYPKNIVKKIKKLLVETGDSHLPYTQEQVALIKEEIIRRGDTQLLLFIEFIYYGFLRPRKEALPLKVEYIQKNTILIPAHISKNRTAKHIVIPPGLQKAIERHKLREYPGRYYIFGLNGKPGEKPLTESCFSKRHSEVLKAVGLNSKGYDMYGYKHTGNINLFESGADLKDIQEQNRHKNIAQTHAYLEKLGLLKKKNNYENFPEL